VAKSHVASREELLGHSSGISNALKRKIASPAFDRDVPKILQAEACDELDLFGHNVVNLCEWNLDRAAAEQPLAKVNRRARGVGTTLAPYGQ
jgi:hypothetical protein